MLIHEPKTKAMFVSSAQKQTMVQANVPQIRCLPVKNYLESLWTKLEHPYRENHKKMQLSALYARMQKKVFKFTIKETVFQCLHFAPHRLLQHCMG